MERPDVDKINGLSPVISIEQKTTSKNPRSTVGTTTEIYDFLRLLYARAGEAYSYVTGKPMIKQTQDQIIDQILSKHEGKKLNILAPMVKGRKGHYRELFVQISKMGYTRVRVDGELLEITPKMQVDRYKIHDIEIVVDRIIPKKEDRYRISQSVGTALKLGEGSLLLLDEGNNVQYFSQNLMDPESGISYEEPSPNSFSFNTPYGACPVCKGMGHIEEITEESIIPDPSLSIMRGGIAPLGEYRDLWIFKQIEALLKAHKSSLSLPIEKIPRNVLEIILYGSEEPIPVASKKYPGTDWNTKFEGIITFLKNQQESESDKIQDWIKDFLIIKECPECHGQRLKKESLHFLIDKKNIAELADMDISSLSEWFTDLESRLSDKQQAIAAEILKEIRKRLGF